MTAILVMANFAVVLSVLYNYVSYIQNLRISMIPSIWYSLIFITSAFISFEYYNTTMESISRIEMNYSKVLNSNKKYNYSINNSVIFKPKRKSIIKLIDNRRSFDLSKWKDKNYLVVKSGYRKSTNTLDINNNSKNRITSWHGDLNDYTCTSMGKRNFSMLIQSPSILDNDDEIFDSPLTTDLRFSNCSSLDDNYNDRVSYKSNDDFDSKLIDMSYNMDPEVSERTTFTNIENNVSKNGNTKFDVKKSSHLTTYVYELIRKRSINKNKENTSCINLKPFHLRKTETS